MSYLLNFYTLRFLNILKKLGSHYDLEVILKLIGFPTAVMLCSHIQVLVLKRHPNRENEIICSDSLAAMADHAGIDLAVTRSILLERKSSLKRSIAKDF